MAARLLILAQCPHHLRPDEAETWLRSELDELPRDGVERVELAPLASVSLRFGRHWDWLVELHWASDAAAARALEGPACLTLLGDLRLLGMRPSVAFVSERTDPDPGV